MRIFICYCKNYFLLFSVIFLTIISYAKSPQSQALHSTTDTVRYLENLISNNKIKTAHLSFTEAEKQFRANQAAHRIRLSELFLSLKKDKKFIEQFPEFRPLINDSKKTVEVLLEHDAAKALDKTKPAIRTLALLQGFDYRTPNKGIPPNIDLEIRNHLKNAIDDINVVDKAIIKEKLSLVSPNLKWAKMHESLTETLDYYDTYKSRSDEIAKDVKSLPPSAWIEKLEKEGAYSPDQLKGNDLKKRFAVYLETVDPLKHPKNFAKGKDFLKGKNSDFTAAIESKFKSTSDVLLAKAQAIPVKETVKFATAATKSLSKIPIISGTITGAQYLIAPESVSANGFLTDLTMTTETSACTTLECHKFMNTCAKKYEIPKKHANNFNKIMKNANFEKCLQDFFNQPLHDQAESRKDTDLNQILLEYSPAVYNISCKDKNNKLHTEVSTMRDMKKLELQTIIYNEIPTVEKIVRSSDEPDQLLFTKNNPTRLQHCQSANKCQSFDYNQVKDERLYFWKDQKSKMGKAISTNKVPIDSFKWAKKSHQLIERQGQKIFDCCQQTSCQKYFVDLNKVIRSNDSRYSSGNIKIRK